jgi:hypothetical protein
MFISLRVDERVGLCERFHGTEGKLDGWIRAPVNSNTRSLEATTTNQNAVMQIDYEEALEALQSQGGLQGLSEFHVSE